MAKLVGIEPVKRKRLGPRYDPDFVMVEGLWEPLPKGWDGKGECDSITPEISLRVSRLVGLMATHSTE